MRRPLVDEQIPSTRVLVHNPATEQLDDVDLGTLIVEARADGSHVLCAASVDDGEVPVVYVVRVRLPLRWETGPAPWEFPSDDRAVDPDLRCELPDGECEGSEHFLLANSHTGLGRLYVACPSTQRAHRADAGTIRPVTSAGKYWLQGFLAGCVPGPGSIDTRDPDGERDLQGWREAEAQFFETGEWNTTPRACTSCGVLLLPSSRGARCRSCRE